MNLSESTVGDPALRFPREMAYAVGHGSKQSRAFAALRDMLLLKRLSGGLRVAESGLTV